jgi:hypothetical protein
MRFQSPRWAGLALLVLGLLGCGGGNSAGSKPKTYPVKGRVLEEDGKPVTGGLIEFRADSAPSLTCRSAIGKDGSFTLITLTDTNEKLDGAIADTHTVIVTPAAEDLTKQSINVQSITLPDKVTVKEGDNDFPEIKIKRPRP